MRNPAASPSTSRELLWLAPAGVVCLMLPMTAAPPRWSLVAVLLWVPIWALAWRRRELNRAEPAAPPFPDLGWATRLTMMRGLLLAALGGFLVLPQADSWLPAVCYGLAALLDRVDGEVARRTQRCSELGGSLDTLYDALGLLLAPLVAVLLGKVHASYLLTGIAFYLFTTGLWWRRRQRLPMFPLAPSALRRTLAGCQMGFVALALLPPLSAPVTRWVGTLFMVPLLLGFVLDWGQVSGRFDPAAPRRVVLMRRLANIRDIVLLPALRFGLALLLLLATPTAVPTAILGVLAAMLLCGVLARLAGALLLVALAVCYDGATIDVVTQLCCAGAVVLLLLGSGRFSLWRADDALLTRP